jgi:hypothetical protein
VRVTARAQRLREQLAAEAMADAPARARRQPAQQRASGAIQGSASLTLIGPPIMPMPANARGSPAPRRRVDGDESPRQALRVEPFGEVRGPSVGEKRKTAIGSMTARGCARAATIDSFYSAHGQAPVRATP